MGFSIITADERLAEPQSIKGIIYGPHGVGKTSLLRTVDPETTLFINLEGGELAVQDVPVDMVRIRSWQDARDMACLISGPSPALPSDKPYSQAHYDAVAASTDPAFLSKYNLVFWDSISVAGRLCLQWCQQQPEALSEKTGKADNRGAYGLLGKELIKWFTVIQHTPRKDVWVVGGLDEKLDDFNRKMWIPQIDGSKAQLEVPGIFDQVVSMVPMHADDGTVYRAFVCHKLNPWGYPAKDRSGRLEVMEKPHLGELMDKIRTAPRKTETTYDLPEE